MGGCLVCGAKRTKDNVFFCGGHWEEFEKSAQHKRAYNGSSQTAQRGFVADWIRLRQLEVANGSS